MMLSIALHILCLLCICCLLQGYYIICNILGLLCLVYLAVCTWYLVKSRVKNQIFVRKKKFLNLIILHLPPKKYIYYLRLQIITEIDKKIISDRVSHRNSVLLFQYEVRTSIDRWSIGAHSIFFSLNFLNYTADLKRIFVKRLLKNIVVVGCVYDRTRKDQYKKYEVHNCRIEQWLWSVRIQISTNPDI